MRFMGSLFRLGVDQLEESKLTIDELADDDSAPRIASTIHVADRPSHTGVARGLCERSADRLGIGSWSPADGVEK